jgi:hypothetical protein
MEEGEREREKKAIALAQGEGVAFQHSTAQQEGRIFRKNNT